MTGGEVFVPKIPSTRVTDIADVLAPGAERRIIGIRPGEKLHEVMVTEDESRHAHDIGFAYVIAPEIATWTVGPSFAGGDALLARLPLRERHQRPLAHAGGAPGDARRRRPPAMVSAVIVQARATSTRLPGKVLADLAGAPLLTRVLERLRLVRGADVVVRRDHRQRDGRPGRRARRARTAPRCSAAASTTCSSRYVGAARALGADLVCRVTSDCPLIDAPAVDDVIDGLATRRATHDYASNRLVRRLPRGLDAEAIWTDVLLRMDRMATSRAGARARHLALLSRAPRPLRAARRGAGGRGRERPALDRRHARRPGDGAPPLRTTSALAGCAGAARTRELLAHVRHHPEIAAMNAHVEQKDA